MKDRVDSEDPPTEVRAMAERLGEFLDQHSLRAARVFDGTWITTIEEPSVYDDSAELTVKYERFDL